MSVTTEKRSLTDRVRKALRYTKTSMPDYFRRMLAQRSEPEGGIGSTYPMTSERIETALLGAVWLPYGHEEILEGCTGAVATIPGRFGLVNLADMPDETNFTLVDPQQTGFCELLLEGSEHRRSVAYTVLILGPTPGGTRAEVVYTFHPGDPIRPSKKEGLEHGKPITLLKATELGFKYAKVV